MAAIFRYETKADVGSGKWICGSTGKPLGCARRWASPAARATRKRSAWSIQS